MDDKVYHSRTKFDEAKSSGQECNRIVLRLVRDPGTTSADDSWQVSSQSGLSRGDAYELGLKIKRSRFKKPARKKPKVLTTTRRPGSTAKRGRGKCRRKRKKLTFNGVTATEDDSTNDGTNQLASQNHFKHIDMLATDCCEMLDSLSAGKWTMHSPRSVGTEVHEDSRALMKNFFQPDCAENVNMIDSVTDAVIDKGGFSAACTEKVQCDVVAPLLDETLQSQKGDGDHQIVNCFERSVCNVFFGVVADAVKTRKRRRFMPKSELSKHRCQVKEGVCDVESVKSVSDFVDVVPVADVSLSDGDGGTQVKITVRRPAKNRRPTKNWYSFSRPVTRRRRRRVTRKQPASDAVTKPESSSTELNEIQSSKMDGFSDGSNFTFRTAVPGDEKLNRDVPEMTDDVNRSDGITAEYAHPACTSTLSLLADTDNATTLTGKWGNDSISTLSPVVPDFVSSVPEILLSESDMKGAEMGQNALASVAVDACEHDVLDCRTAAAAIEDILAAENSVSSLNCFSLSHRECLMNAYEFPFVNPNCGHLSDSELTAAIQSIEAENTELILDSASAESENVDTVDDSGVSPEQRANVDFFTGYCDQLRYMQCPSESAGVNVLTEAASGGQAGVFGSATKSLLSGDVEFDADVLEHTTPSVHSAVDFIPVDCGDVAFVKDDTSITALCNDVDGTLFPSDMTCADVETAETTLTGQHENIADKVCTVSPVSVVIMDQCVHASEIHHISNTLLSVTDSVTHGECDGLCSDCGIPNASIEICKPSIECSVSSVTMPESSLSVKRTASHHHRGRKSRRSTISHRKNVAESVSSSHRAAEHVPSLSNGKVSEDFDHLIVNNCSPCRDVVVASSTESHCVGGHDRGPVSDDTSAESGLPVQRSSSHNHRGRNSHRHHRPHRKTSSSNPDVEDHSHCCAETSAKLSNGTAISEEKCDKCDQLTVDTGRFTSDQCRVGLKSVEAHDKAEETHGANAKTGSAPAPIMKHHDASSSGICNGVSKLKSTKRIQHAYCDSDRHAKQTSDQLSSLCSKIKRSLSIDHMDISSCLLTMSMLERLPVSSQILAKNADILVTIKKGHCEQQAMRDEGVIHVAGHPLLNRRCTRLPGCIRLRNDLYCVEWGVKLYSLTRMQCRKFKGSAEVRTRAGVIYDKFKTLFQLPADTVDNHEVADSEAKMSNRRRNHSESINSQQISHTNADGHCNRSAGSSGSLKTRVCQHRTASDEALTAIETVAGTGTECPASNRIDTSRPFKHIDAAHDSLTTVFDKSENVSDVHSPAFEVTTDNRDTGAQDIGKLTTVKVDKTEVTENVVSDTMNSVYSDHVHRYEDLVDTSSAREPEDHDLDVFGCEKRSPVDNVVNIINGPLSTNLLAHDCEAVSDSQSPPDNTFAADNAAGGRSSEFSMNKKRKVSAARSALYRRLLSSDPAEASDVDVSSDIFDSQSLSSDEDSDANDLNLSSDHSCLNPSDSELEERITRIIAEEDEEIVRRHCTDCRLPLVPTKPPELSRPSTGASACDKTNSSRSVDRETSDIDDDELHHLLGVD